MRNIEVIGRVVTDAEIKQTKNGASYLEFRFANNEFGDPEGSTYWFRVTSYQPNAVNLKKYILKGKPLFVSGRYKDRLYTTQSGGIEIGRDITANTIEFISTGENREQTQHAPETKADANAGIPAVDIQVLKAKQEEPKPKAAPANVKAADDDDDLPF